jgi:hypothetical protein
VVEVVTLDCELLQNARTYRGAHLVSYSVGAGVKRLGLATLLLLVKVKVILLEAMKAQRGVELWLY